MEGLRVSDASLIVYIHPSKANKVQEAILRQLSSLLFQFDETFDGVVLAYDIKVRSKDAKILPGTAPYFGVKLKAKLLLYSPKPDMLLEGKVVKLGKESIHVIVLGFSSAAISSEDIREEFRYKIRHGEGAFVSHNHKRHVIEVGSMLCFLVKSFDEEMLHISGSLLPANTGCIRWLYKHTAEEASFHHHTIEGASPLRKHRNITKHRERIRELGIQEQYSKELNRRHLSSNHDKPHKKRRVAEEY